jgi:hypothetical protein
MGRKKMTLAATPSQPATQPADNTQGGAGKPGRKRGAKTLAVKDAMDHGVTSPTEISQYVKQHHGLDVTPAHVSTIKGTLRRAAGAKKGKGGRPKRVEALTQPVAAPPTTKAPARNGGGLSPQDLTELLSLANRLGGVEKLEEYVAALKQVR